METDTLPPPSSPVLSISHTLSSFAYFLFHFAISPHLSGSIKSSYTLVFLSFFLQLSVNSNLITLIWFLLLLFLFLFLFACFLSLDQFNSIKVRLTGWKRTDTARRFKINAPQSNSYIKLRGTSAFLTSIKSRRLSLCFVIRSEMTGWLIDWQMINW